MACKNLISVWSTGRPTQWHGI